MLGTARVECVQKREDGQPEEARNEKIPKAGEQLQHGSSGRTESNGAGMAAKWR